jgi:hypothetical protein
VVVLLRMRNSVGRGRWKLGRLLQVMCKETVESIVVERFTVPYSLAGILLEMMAVLGVVCYRSPPVPAPGALPHRLDKLRA